MKPWVVFVHSGGWRPEEVERAGLTGAEEVLTYLARELARIGYRVAVVLLGDSGNDRIVDGVRYTGAGYLSDHWRNDPLGNNTTLIVSMFPNFILEPAVSKLRASRRIFWAHSIGFDDVKSETWGRFCFGDVGSWSVAAGVVCATQWQALAMTDRYLSTGSVRYAPTVIPYGIVPPPPLPKVPGKCLYASSPDRGLLRLLRWWPDVLAACPDLTLYVAYGRERMRERAKHDKSCAVELAGIENFIEQPCVVDLGFQSKPDLDRHIAETEFWLYPTAFEETGCLTGRRLEAAGAIPVYSAYGCLPEVMAGRPFWNGVGAEFGPIDSDAARAAFVATIKKLHRPEFQGMRLTNVVGWKEAAEKWDRLLDPKPVPA